MQASVRTRYNHALEYAVFRANTLALPLDVLFVVTPSYPGATARHYRFLIEGLHDVAQTLSRRGLTLRVLVGDPPVVVPDEARSAELLVMDRAYLRIHRDWRRAITKAVSCEVVQVESNIVVPVEFASDKEEYSAATIRRKIHRAARPFLAEVETQEPARSRTVPARRPDSPHREIAPQRLADADGPLRELGWAPPRPTPFTGGETAAREHLMSFLDERLELFAANRNDPFLDWGSNMSPYLHFGHISPVEIAREASANAGMDGVPPFPETGRTGLDSLLEEVIVRRELAINFVFYNDGYDRYSCIPDWARRTLSDHATDQRPHLYDENTLREARTADPYWNACQTQMVETGKMHGYMRMYWGKKIIEWSPSPEEAFAIAMRLNDEFELDGRDPNGYAGIAWCFGKHDRPWTERAIFGKVRYMNDRGLRRKFKIDAFAERWGTLG